MKVETVGLDKLTPDPINARVHPDRNLAAIRASLEKFGQVEPLVVRKRSRVVVGGNGRLEAMKALGWKDAKVVEVDIDDDEAKALSIALNRASDLAGWDERRLAETFKELSETDWGNSLDALQFDGMVNFDKLDDLDFLSGVNEPEKEGEASASSSVGGEHVTVSFVVTPAQQQVVLDALRKARAQERGTQGDRLAVVCQTYLENENA